jgi:hypothetical protein
MTYVERDVRAALQVKDLAAFQRFLALCAGRVGQLLNISSLAADAGVSRATTEAWLSVLQASYLVFLARPHHTNLSKRLVKMPKLYFHDVGLAAWLIGVRAPEQLTVHPLRGALFENWVITEIVKELAARGEPTTAYFWRDRDGHEVDAIIEHAAIAHGVEIKSGQTIATDFFDQLDFWKRQQRETATCRPWLVYGGSTQQPRARGQVVPWVEIETLLRAI